MTEENNKELAERLGSLLAQSPLDEEVKDFLAENIDNLPEGLVYKLLDSLELEQGQLSLLEEELRSFMKERDKKWDHGLPQAQKELAEKIAADEFLKITEEK